MGDVALPPGLPQGAVPIVRNVQAAGVVYTVPAGRKLHVTHAYVAGAGSTTAGRVTLTADVYRDATRTVLEIALPASAAGAAAETYAGTDVHVGPGDTVDLATSGLTGGAVAAGITGWEEALTPGQGTT